MKGGQVNSSKTFFWTTLILYFSIHVFQTLSTFHGEANFGVSKFGESKFTPA